MYLALNSKVRVGGGKGGYCATLKDEIKALPREAATANGNRCDTALLVGRDLFFA